MVDARSSGLTSNVRRTFCCGQSLSASLNRGEIRLSTMISVRSATVPCSLSKSSGSWIRAHLPPKASIASIVTVAATPLGATSRTLVCCRQWCRSGSGVPVDELPGRNASLKVLPSPLRLKTVRLPPNSRTMRAEIASPSPVPHFAATSGLPVRIRQRYGLVPLGSCRGRCPRR